MDGIKLRPRELRTALALCFRAQQPVFVWGSPGIGKSDIVRLSTTDVFGSPAGQEWEDDPLRDVRATLLDPVDCRGIPHLKDGRTAWAAPDWLPVTGHGVFFADELNAASRAVQASLYQLFLDRRLGEARLGDGWSLAAAGNLESDRAVTTRMPTALASRFLHYELVVSLDDWCVWALNHGILPEIVAFLRFRPALLHQFDPASASKAFACPRTWAFTSRMLNLHPSREIEYATLSGCVGEGAAAELVGFLRIYRQLPSPDAIMLDPERADVPTDPATLYALCGALSQRASTKNADRMVKYFSRLPQEFSVLAIRDSVAVCADFQRTAAFGRWAADNTDVIF